MMLRPQSLLTLGHRSAKQSLTRLTTPIILRQMSSVRVAGGNMIVRRLLSTGNAGHDHSGDLKHFENYRNEDAIPFGVDNKFWWAFKLSLVSVVGLGAPIFIVYWQM